MNIAELQRPVRAQKAETADLTVVGGAGHVGIPLVLSFSAKGLDGQYQRYQQRCLGRAEIRPCPVHRGWCAAAAHQGARRCTLFFTSQPSGISTKGPVIVTIGTPVDEFLNPVRDVIGIASILCCRICATGNFWCCGPRFIPAPPTGSMRISRRKGRKIKIAFCPERIVSGQRHRGARQHAATCQRHVARG